MVIFLLTSPHSKCNSVDDHRHCDRSGNLATDIIANICYQSGFPLTVFKADRYRSECDLNRIQCNNISYRQSIRTWVTYYQNNQSGQIINLDIHSFPPYSSNSSEPNGSTSEVNSEYDFYLIGSLSEINRQIIDNIRRAGYRATIFPPSGVIINNVETNININDITRELTETYHIPTFLLEFSEQLTPDQIEDISQIIISTIIKN